MTCNKLPVSQEVINMINDKKSKKVLATTGKNGIPHVVVKDSFFFEDGELVYLELLEGSTTNKNMIYSLWFEKEVAVNIFNDNGCSIQIKGVPIKTIVAGSIFEKFYNMVQSWDVDSDLSAIYYISVKEVIDESYSCRKKDHELKHPLYIHIDRLAK